MIFSKIKTRLGNESGIAIIIMVVAALVILATIGLSFVVELQSKHQGSALTATANQAQKVAEAGYRYTEKCLLGNDAACFCNTGPPNDCYDWANLVNFGPISFGAGNGGQFSIGFSNQALCRVDIASTGTVVQASRTINRTLTRSTTGVGATMAVNNPQGTEASGSGPIALLNLAGNQSEGNGINTISIASYTVPAGQDLVLIVVAGAEGGGTNPAPISATFGGTPMNLIDNVVGINDGGSEPGVGMFRLAVTSGQSGAITVTTSGNTQNRTIGAFTLTNAVDTAEAVVLNGGAQGPTQVTDSITTLSDGALIITNTYSRQDNDLTPLGAGHSEISPADFVPTEAEWGVGTINAATAGTFAGVGFATSPAQNTQFAQMLVAIPQAGQSISLGYTVPALVGNDLVLVAAGGGEDGIAPFVPGSTLPVSATFNGNPMIVGTTVNALSANNFEAGQGLFYKSVLPGESGTIIVNFSGGVDDRTLHAFTLSGASTAGPEAVVTNSDNNGGVTLTGSITTLTDGATVVTSGYQGNANNLAAIGTNHIRRDFRQSGSSAGAMGSVAVPTATGITGIGWDPASNFNRMVLILASFSPAQTSCPIVTPP